MNKFTIDYLSEKDSFETIRIRGDFLFPCLPIQIVIINQEYRIVFRMILSQKII